MFTFAAMRVMVWYIVALKQIIIDKHTCMPVCCWQLVVLIQWDGLIPHGLEECKASLIGISHYILLCSILWSLQSKNLIRDNSSVLLYLCSKSHECALETNFAPIEMLPGEHKLYFFCNFWPSSHILFFHPMESQN